MITALSSILIIILLARLWAGESCRRQEQRDDLQDQGITSGPQWQRANSEFFK